MNQIILFDSDCLMCNSFIQFAFNLNNTYQFAALNSEYSQSIIKDNCLSNIDSIFFVSNNNVYHYSTAVAKIFLSSNQLHYRIIGTLILVIPKPIRDFFYRKTTLHRKSISMVFNYNSCNLDIKSQIIS